MPIGVPNVRRQVKLIDLNASLDVFFGQAHAAEARVYARWISQAPQADLCLAGTLTGPQCLYAQTLPAVTALADLGPGQSLLAQAVVTDPCFWTPDLPYLYDLHVELRRQGETLASADRSYGIRPLGARGRRFYYAGKHWVLRAVRCQAPDDETLAQCRDAAAALVLDNPGDCICEAASRQGVLILADLSGQTDPLEPNLRRLARHASVGFMLLPRSAAGGPELRAWAPNAVLVQPLDGAQDSVRPWAQACLASADVVSSGGLAHAALPVIAYRPAGQTGSISQRRAQCDILQRDLAGAGELAGYVV